MHRVKGEIQVLCQEVPRFLCQIPALASRLSSHVCTSLEAEDLSLSPGSIAYWFCDFGQVT